MAQAFISYSTKDVLTAEEVCSGLEQAGLDCWMGPRNLTPAESREPQIVEAVRHSQVMVLIFSSAANQSNNVMRELQLARSYAVPIIALRIDGEEPAGAFS